MNEFLKLEYEQCLKLITYYDERHHSLVKYAAGLSSAIPSLLLAIWNLSNGANVYFWQFATLISVITAIGLSSIFTVMVQTRLYFIYPVRQVNAIREVSLADNEVAKVFSNNQMYLSTNFSAFKLLSAHTVLNGFIALQIGAFFGLSLFCYMFDGVDEGTTLIYESVVAGLIVASAIFGLSAWYLHVMSKYHPDVSVHNKKIK